MKVLKVIILSPILFLSLHSRGEFSDQLPRSTADSGGYLKDYPSITMENLRYILPAENWPAYKKYIAKGNYIQILKRNINAKEDKYKGPLNFYETKEIVGSPAFVYQDSNMTSKDKVVCPYIEDVESVNGAFECNNYSCRYLKGKHQVYNYHGLTSLKKQCVFWPDVHDSSSYPDYYSYNIKVSNNSLADNYAETEINGRTYFLDIRFCKKDPTFCKPVTIKHSLMEQAWMNLKFTQEHKKYSLLNYLIENLLPCVKKKDAQCVKSFFMTKEEAENSDNITPLATVQNITQQTFKDLEACLNYESLLPFGGRTRATGDRVCIFSPTRDKLYSITLPDAYRTNADGIFVNYGK